MIRALCSKRKPRSSVESVKDEEENDFVDDDVALMTQKIKTDCKLLGVAFLHFFRMLAIDDHVFLDLIH